MGGVHTQAGPSNVPPGVTQGNSGEQDQSNTPMLAVPPLL
jgi:hypothetical protein